MPTGSLRPMTRDDLETVLEWRNRPDVRANMFTSHVISHDEHHAWWARTERDPEKRYFVFVCDGIPSGVVGFVDISERHRTAMWGFYSSDPQRRGIGALMGQAALDYAFGSLRVEKLSSEVLGFNRASLMFQRKLGFRVEGIFRNHFSTEAGCTDVYRLAVFRRDWEHMRDAPDPGLPKPGTHLSQPCTVTREQIEAFATATGNPDPAHLDPAEARPARFDATAHELLLGSVFRGMLQRSLPPLGTVYRNQCFAFLRPARLGERLTAEVRVLSRIGSTLILQTTITDAENHVVVDGEAEVLVGAE